MTSLSPFSEQELIHILKSRFDAHSEQHSKSRISSCGNRALRTRGRRSDGSLSLVLPVLERLDLDS